MNNEFTLLIHGGTGAILRENMTRKKEVAYREVLEAALQTGENILKASGSAMDAVEATIRVMEDSDLFNAGKGAVFNHKGKNEMDASIMDGETLNAGAVAGVTNLKNPTTAARMVMEKSGHVMLVGSGAKNFAQGEGCDIESPEYFYSQDRFDQLQLALKDDVVVLDHSSPSKGGANIEN